LAHYFSLMSKVSKNFEFWENLFHESA
jgi:hypothetical protein